jgi:hypothetical protein
VGTAVADGDGAECEVWEATTRRRERPGVTGPAAARTGR